ncbi:PAAR domain-containing protein [Tahibacter harae]|uniref:PAAR domain-containing protein n=1 Tax=Tahibacter harae TaxID=2963937 RepID=A0ABT1QYW0_9GAMM|nr:PAAR domain-containing protein [Tahibacter harae]MCQ4167484.1 PAAR domain-containing protein [Tahibacter harae]
MSDVLTLPTVTSMTGVVHITPDQTLWNIRTFAGSDRLLIERSAYSAVAIDGSNEVPLRDWSPTYAEYEQYRKDNPGLDLPHIEKPDEKPATQASRHIANATTWRAECVDPDWCDVNGTPIAFDSYAEIEQEKLASPNVKAQGVPVYRQGDMHQGIKADAGAHVVSRTSQATGFVKIVQGQSNVKVNGLPVARHESECLINCDANGLGGTAGLLRTDIKTMFRQKTQEELAIEMKYFDEARRNADERAAETQRELDEVRRELSETTLLLDWTRRRQIKERIARLETQMRVRGSDALYYRDQAAHAFAMAYPEAAAGPTMSAALSWNERRETELRTHESRRQLERALLGPVIGAPGNTVEAMGATAQVVDWVNATALDTAGVGKGMGNPGSQRSIGPPRGFRPPHRPPIKPQGIFIRPHERDIRRFDELARDPAHNGAISPKTWREAEVGMEMEARGDLKFPIRRDPRPNGGEFIDRDGVVWDIKGFNSSFKTGFKLEKAVEAISREVGRGENVIIDTARMSAEHVSQLRHAIDKAGLSGNVKWYP